MTAPQKRRSSLPAFGRVLALWAIAAAICFGLGYATLNRYDPRTTGNSDSTSYYSLVKGSPEDVEGFQRFRVLVPFLAKPIYWLGNGFVGSWNPVSFALLTICSMLVSVAVCIIAFQARSMNLDSSVGLLASALYLLNFTVTNGQLAGLVDSGEACCFALLYLLLSIRRSAREILAISALGVLGGLAKETFVPLAGALALGWRAAEGLKVPRRLRYFLVEPALIVGLGFITIISVRYMYVGRWVAPWEMVEEFARPKNLFARFAGIFGTQLVYVFGWLLPLAIVGFHVVPSKIRAGVAASAALAILLGVHNDSGGNVARAIFNLGGPAFCLAAAHALSRLAHVEESRHCT